jgi:hypothetical protein
MFDANDVTIGNCSNCTRENVPILHLDDSGYEDPHICKDCCESALEAFEVANEIDTNKSGRT